MSIEYLGLSSINGPLIALEGVQDAFYDEIVELIEKEEFTADPIGAYENRIYSKSAPMKTAVVWNETYIDMER